MSISRKILSDIVVYSKYARYLPKEQRRETWEEIVLRNASMHAKKFPTIQDEIYSTYQYVLNKQVLPSMRSLQFGGKPIEISPNRLFNCAYMPIDDVAAFSETMFLLLGGTGVGYSVQRHHVDKLPEILGPKKRGRRYLIGDNIEGWADAVKVLINAYFYNKADPIYDFRDIRPKGSLLVTSGGKAPGPQPLKDCLHNIRKVFDGAIEARGTGTQLTTLEVHDIICYIADAVLAGGIRRAALISLFSFDDEDMLSCKFGNWWELHPQRARANNSAVALRHRIKRKDFFEFWEKVKASGCGEPGIYFTNDKEWGANPSLRRGTKVITANGILPIEKLQDSDFDVINLDGQWSSATCRLSGKNKQLYKLTLEGGHQYYATKEHKWPTVDISSLKTTKFNTNDLRSGQYLPIIRKDSLFESSFGTYDDGFFFGWLYGDGWFNKKNNSLGLIVSKTDGFIIRNKLESYLRTVGCNASFKEKGSTFELSTTSKTLMKHLASFGAENKESLLSSLWTSSESMRKGFIDGIFSSDGHVEKNDKRICLTNKSKTVISEISELLGFYGIKTSIKQKNTKLYDREYQSYVLTIGENGSIRHFIKIFSLSHKDKQDRISSYTFQRNSGEYIKIVSVEATDLYEDVWDIGVRDHTHCFQIAHCVTGNCVEIALRPCQFCNLTTVNVSDVEDQADLNSRVRAAAFIGTLQASYTDFHYLRDVWQTTTEKDALIGVSMTGIASGKVLKYNLNEAAEVVKEENARVAKLIGINPAARTTCIKPEGTASLVVGSSSGIHAWHAPFYIRRMRLGKNEPIYTYLSKVIPDLLEDETLKPDLEAVLSIPIKAPDNSIYRTESAIDLLERGKLFSTTWVTPGHISGENMHNVSITVSVRDNEWDQVGDWMWQNRKLYNGISVLPYDGGSYVQAPFEECSEQVYSSMLKKCHAIYLNQVVETEDYTSLKEEAACAGGACEITKVGA